MFFLKKEFPQFLPTESSSSHSCNSHCQCE